MSKTKFVVKLGGLGGFLNPPKDVEHKYGVHEFYTANGKKCGMMSVRHAMKCDYVPENIKSQLQQLIDEHKGEFTEEWEHSCYNYFRHCYSPDGINRSVSDCIIDNQNTRPPTHHLAYLHIKSFFPDYEPNEFLIQNNGDKGSWSSKNGGVK